MKGEEQGRRFGEEESKCNTVLRKFHQGGWGGGVLELKLPITGVPSSL